MNLTTMILNTILMIKSTSDSKDKDSNKPLSADSTHRNYKMKDDNLVDQLYDNFKSQSVDFSKYWEPNKYEDSFSLTSLIQNLFDFDSDITDYEQPQKTSHSSNDEKDQVDQADQAKQPSQHQEPSQSSAKQDQESSNDEKKRQLTIKPILTSVIYLEKWIKKIKKAKT